MRYFSTQRPITPGAFPKPQGNVIESIFNFDDPQFCSEIGRNAWGYLDYTIPLTEKDCKAYELTPEGLKLFWCVTSAFSDQGKVTAAITKSTEGMEKPEDRIVKTKRKEIRANWFDSRESAERFIEGIKKEVI